MTSPLESFADRVDPIVRRLSPDAATALLDVLPELTKLLASEQVQQLTYAVSAVSSVKGSHAFMRAVEELADIAKLLRDVPAPERAAYLTMRRMDVRRAAAEANERANREPRAPRVPRETPVTVEHSPMDTRPHGASQ